MIVKNYLWGCGNMSKDIHEIIEELRCYSTQAKPVEGYVYTNNLSYIQLTYHLLRVVNELAEIVMDTIDQNIDDYINSKFDELMINAIYDPETETIILERGVLNG